MIQRNMNFAEHAGTALRDRGRQMARVRADEAIPGWTDRTIAALRRFCEKMKQDNQATFLMEEFRATRSHCQPPSPNAWGSIPQIAARLGIIVWTGEYRNAASARTHAHPVKLWKVV